jgi:hypothetical protein
MNEQERETVMALAFFNGLPSHHPATVNLRSMVMENSKTYDEITHEVLNSYEFTKPRAALATIRKWCDYHESASHSNEECSTKRGRFAKGKGKGGKGKAQGGKGKGKLKWTQGKTYVFNMNLPIIETNGVNYLLDTGSEVTIVSSQTTSQMRIESKSQQEKGIRIDYPKRNQCCITTLTGTETLNSLKCEILGTEIDAYILRKEGPLLHTQK